MNIEESIEPSDDRTSPVLHLTTPRLLLTLPPPAAADRMLQYARDNETHLAEWSPPRPSEYYTEAYWQQRLANARSEFHRGESLRLVLFNIDSENDAIVGDCNFT